jgi:hypothetical protein
MAYLNEYQIIISCKEKQNMENKNTRKKILLTWPVLMPTDKLSASLNLIHDTAGKLKKI